MAELEHPEAPRHVVEREFLDHSEVIKGFIRALVPRRESADDVYQEVYLTAVARADQYVPGTRFAAWARAIARNKIRKLFERRSTLSLSLDPDVAEVLADEAEVYDEDRDEHRRILERCLGTIGEAARRLLDMRFVEQLTPVAIAARLRRTVNGVSVGLSKAQVALRRCVLRQLAERGLRR
jgi:RNA polymerase sigma-70 factor, ECF subfamily